MFFQKGTTIQTRMLFYTLTCGTAGIAFGFVCAHCVCDIFWDKRRERSDVKGLRAASSLLEVWTFLGTIFFWGGLGLTLGVGLDVGTYLAN